ncbi:DUF488 domain-containing protein [Elizabethkingia sp. JS20170427COW]|uniref:DUF488 domain-containing protein n=1 Tax=Elizabethkingia sp. JS20170427COW TaxID=2583851 RepID=UPI0011102CAB|nr:DUF488 family protein [Elizabethkingia sp. JS20170427COW]QCX53920.1 DUF488 family protein [Elizabethkingia sp. JS20170427COW]
MKTELQIKRIYEEASPEDGYRILVDRIWPRGVSKEKAQLDEWDKEIAPTTELRKWYNHEIEKWPDFKIKFTEELLNNPNFKSFISTVKSHQKVSLIYAAKDGNLSNAQVILEILQNRLED